MKNIPLLIAIHFILFGVAEGAKADCVGGPSDTFVEIVAGFYHTCGLTAEGVAYCWGRDDYGQLGDGGTSTDSQSPVLVDTSSIAGEKAFVALTVGNYHTCGLTSEGVAYCWGRDGYGQLGDGDISIDDCDGSPCTRSPVPVDTSPITGEKVFTALSAGVIHTCGLTAEGVAYCWGHDFYGQLGDGETSTLQHCRPVAVDTSQSTGEKVFVAISAGGYITCILTAEGVPYCWGRGDTGALGSSGDLSDSHIPIPVDTSPITGEKAFIAISTGLGHACGLTAEGVVYCWGFDYRGQLGDGDTAIEECLVGIYTYPCSQIPVLVDTSTITGEKAFVAISAGGINTCGLTAEGVAYCWGDDQQGDLGDGDMSLDDCDGYPCSQSPVPVYTNHITGEKAFIALTTGMLHACGLTAEGAAYCWGWDLYGQLGDGGTSTDSQIPMHVDTSPISGEKTFVALAGGGDYSCGLTSEGVPYCWGNDQSGEIGDGGTSTDSHIPVPVDTSPITGEKAFVALSAGREHACGLTSEGAAYCWGRDLYGALGDSGTSSDSQSPVLVDTSTILGDKAFVALSAGCESTCGLTAEGVAYCWGTDQHGQLGDGVFEENDCGSIPCSQNPVLVDTSSIAGEKALVAITTGGDNSCGLTAEGVAYCWGNNSVGQLGEGRISTSLCWGEPCANRPVPVNTSPITGEKAFVALSTGYWHTCGLTAEGVAYCWGSDHSGQLGNGDMTIDSCGGAPTPCSWSPVEVDTSSIVGETTFVALSAGMSHTCGLTSEGVAYCWGDNFAGQLGDGGNTTDICTAGTCSQIPVLVDTSQIAGEKAFVAIASGFGHTCGLTAEGVAYCWGHDRSGELGDGNISIDDCDGFPCAQSPVPVERCSTSCFVDTDCQLCKWCDAGSCGYQSPGSDSKDECLANPCTTGECDGFGACGFFDNSTFCGDDGLYCTVGDLCVDGTCGEMRDCSEFTDQCNYGVCDEDIDFCIPDPTMKEGQPCEDGTSCSSHDFCQGGICVTGPTDKDTDGDNYIDEACPGGDDCNDSDPDVNPGVFEGPFGSALCTDLIDNDCDGLTDTPDDPACCQCLLSSDCDDNDVCNGSEVCVDCSCIASTPLDCDDGNNCTSDDCDPLWGCLLTDLCNDGLYCNGIETCENGTCNVGQDPCPGMPCDEENDECFACLNDSVCDDGLYCSGVETCDPPIGCLPGEDPCPGQICDEVYDYCVKCGPGHDACPLCTWCPEEWVGCVPQPSGNDVKEECPANSCMTGTCNGSGECAVVDNGALCDDGDACTMDDSCSGDICAGEPLDGDHDSYISDNCGGRDCDDTDPNIHPGAPERCNDVDDDCDGNTDDLGIETCGNGPCEVSVEVCVNGDVQECVPLEPEEYMERTCTDGIDNDCDGNIDYNDINCKGRTDAGDTDYGHVAGGGCGCKTGGYETPGVIVGIFGLILLRRRRQFASTRKLP